MNITNEQEMFLLLKYTTVADKIGRLLQLNSDDKYHNTATAYIIDKVLDFLLTNKHCSSDALRIHIDTPFKAGQVSLVWRDKLILNFLFNHISVDTPISVYPRVHAVYEDKDKEDALQKVSEMLN